MQISAKNLGLFKKNNKNLNPFENSKQYKFLDFTWIEIILPRSYKNIDKDTIFIKFWNANIGKNIGLFKKIIKIKIPYKIQRNISFWIYLESK